MCTAAIIAQNDLRRTRHWRSIFRRDMYQRRIGVITFESEGNRGHKKTSSSELLLPWREHLMIRWMESCRFMEETEKEREMRGSTAW